MTVSDSTFLLDVSVEQLVPFGDNQELRIKTKCADLFDMELYDLKQFNRSWQTNSYRTESFLPRKDGTDGRKFGETIILVNNVNQILSNMENRHLDFYLWSNIDTGGKHGISRIPWTQKFIYYVKNIHRSPKLPPVVHNEVCNVVNEIQRKSLGTVVVTVKLICMGSHFYKFISRSKRSIYMYTCLFSNPEKIIKLNNLIRKSNKCKRNRGLGKVESIRESKQNDYKQALEETKEKVKEQKFSYKEKIKANYALENTETKFEDFGEEKTKYNPYDYIFGDPYAAFDNRVYLVNYFTVNKSNKTSKQSSVNSVTSEKQVENKRIHIKKCNSECLKKSHSASNITSTLDLPLNVDSSLVKITSCKEISCDSKVHRKVPAAIDNTISLDFSNVNKNCCNLRELTQKIEEVRGGVTANMKYGDDQCFCSCECQFEFIKKTTYCKVCGGYEVVGEEFTDKRGFEIPMPCPIYHKLVDKNKLKAHSTSGSELKRKVNDSLRSIKLGSSQKASSEKRLGVSDKKSVESEKESKKEKKKKKDDRFKFNYGYKGIPPQIGHSQCTSPCSGTLENVPKNMGWLWTADCIPGMKFRPMWKPGATNKQVVRLLRIAKNPGEVLSKKKKKDVSKQKRPLKRPLLAVYKKDGEYTVTMETMKSYSKPRAVHQYPYENKPVLTYTIGRTEEENKERQKKKEREQRRLERAQRMYVQSAFKNMCNEICLKTYQQALGILPNAEDPQCPCYPSLLTTEEVDTDKSCSCSEGNSINGSDTDSDEWLVEFTPPNALFNPLQKVKKTTTVDNGSQYTYLDYRVKLLDRFGNPVPRFFKGPDGKEQCSDLGGFWSPDQKWLEINVHGYIGPDGRWAPNSFIGPSGDTVNAETGKFQDKNGQWLVVGTDGYINSQGKWCFYPKYRRVARQKKRFIPTKISDQRAKHKVDKDQYHSESSWSCFGDASPNQLSRLRIIGHAKDKRLLLSKLQDMVARGQNVKIPQQSQVFHFPHQWKKTNKSVSKKYIEEIKCKHPVPSDKGIVAINSEGDKTYFRLKHNQNKRSGERISTLTKLGISLSSFHVPCFSSFIKSEMIKQGHCDHTSTDKTTETGLEYINT